MKKLSSGGIASDTGIEDIGSRLALESRRLHTVVYEVPYTATAATRAPHWLDSTVKALDDAAAALDAKDAKIRTQQAEIARATGRLPSIHSADED